MTARTTVTIEYRAYSGFAAAIADIYLPKSRTRRVLEDGSVIFTFKSRRPTEPRKDVCWGRVMGEWRTLEAGASSSSPVNQ